MSSEPNLSKVEETTSASSPVSDSPATPDTSGTAGTEAASDSTTVEPPADGSTVDETANPVQALSTGGPQADSAETSPTATTPSPKPASSTEVGEASLVAGQSADTASDAVRRSETADTPGAADQSNVASGEPASAAPETAAPVVTPSTESASESGKAAFRRKIQLRPVGDPSQFRAVPSVGGPAAPTVDAGSEEAAPSESVPIPPPEAVEIPEAEELEASLDAEIEAALSSGEASAEVVVAPQEGSEEAPTTVSVETLEEGAKLSGTIQSIHEDNVFLDFGLRLSGVVSLRQFGKKTPTVGQSCHVIVSKVDEGEGLILCNLPRSSSRISGDWDAISVGQVVDCMVTKTNKGGLEVTVGSLRAFIPASQVELGYVAELEPYVGQKLQAKVSEVKPNRRKLVLSRRQLLAEEREAVQKERLAELEVGAAVSGRIKTIKDYGAFIDLGGVDGFLHIGQISWQRITHPSDVLEVGQNVEVQILSIDAESGKISLGMRQLTQNPWSNAEANYPKDSEVTGRVTRTESYGAFIELEPGLEGLVHVSELEHRHVKNVSEVVKVDQVVQLKVLDVDPRKRRISLSMKALVAAPELQATESGDEEKAARPPVSRPRTNLKGGISGPQKGGLFGDPRDFG